MLTSFLENSVRFIVLVLLQVFILNNIQMSSFLSPYLYVLFILSLPIDTPRGLTLILGFVTGFTIDVFTRTPGMHTMASTLLAYMRPIILRFIEPREGYELGMQASLKQFGITWYLGYASILVFIHHFTLFLVEAFRFQELGYILAKAMMSTIFTLILIFIVQLLSSNRRIID